MPATRVQPATCQTLEGSGFTSCSADTKDGTFRNRNGVVISICLSLLLHQAVCAVLLHITLLSAHMVSVILILQRRKLKLR